MWKEHSVPRQEHECFTFFLKSFLIIDSPSAVVGDNCRINE